MASQRGIGKANNLSRQNGPTADLGDALGFVIVRVGLLQRAALQLTSVLGFHFSFEDFIQS